MRGFVAVLLVALFSSLLIGPAVSAQDAESSLPACCRRGGDHRCAMAKFQAGPESGTAARAAKCASFPVEQGLPGGPGAASVSNSPPGFALVVAHPQGQLQTQAWYRISRTRGDQKRGPPSHS